MRACSETRQCAGSSTAALCSFYCACCAGTKQELKELYDDRQIIQFAEFYPVGHR